MARGWESKSVEAQMESTEEKPSGNRPLSAEEAARERERESLRLSRARVLQQLENAHEPRYVKLLNDALEDLNTRLSSLK